MTSLHMCEREKDNESFKEKKISAFGLAVCCSCLYDNTNCYHTSSKIRKIGKWALCLFQQHLHILCLALKSLAWWWTVT